MSTVLYCCLGRKEGGGTIFCYCYVFMPAATTNFYRNFSRDITGYSTCRPCQSTEVLLLLLLLLLLPWILHPKNILFLATNKK